jgi:O-antigen ligase
MAIAPALLGTVAALYALLWVSWQWRTIDWQRCASSTVARLLLGVTVLSMLSAFWALSPQVALSKAGTFALLMWPLTVVGVFLAEPQRRTHGAAIVVLVSLGVSICLVAWQVAGGFLLSNWMHGPGRVPAALKLNIPAAAFILIAWSIPALTRNLGYAWRALGAATMVACMLIAMAGEGSAPRLALVAGGCCWLLARRWPRALALAIALGTATYHGLSLTVPTRLYAAPELAGWVHDISIRHRLDIWAFVGDLIAVRPWLGYGFRNSTEIPPAREISTVTGRPRAVPMYPHNILLQAQLELGLPGVVLFYAWLVHVLRALVAAPVPVRTGGLAVLAATLSIWCVGYPLWRASWLAWLVYCGYVLSIAARVPDAPKK